MKFAQLLSNESVFKSDIKIVQGVGLLESGLPDLCCDELCKAFKEHDEYYESPPRQGKSAIIEDLEYLPFVSNILEQYRNKIPFGEQVFNNIIVAEYKEGDECTNHFDGPFMNNSVRSLSTIINLNDDYEGGEFEMPFQELKIKPKKGLSIIFPPTYTYTHKVNKITKGVRYVALISFFYKDIPNNIQNIKNPIFI